VTSAITAVLPSLRLERSLLRAGHALVGGIDEVGRGPLAGPIYVGLVVIDTNTPTAPRGVRDSKATKPNERAQLSRSVKDWAWSTTASVDAQFIDRFGLTQALRECVNIAYGNAQTAGMAPSAIILDGSYNFCDPDLPLSVVMRKKADQSSSSVAAASIIAKVERDEFMCERSVEFPGYGWERNSGYGTREHLEAIERFGLTKLHRTSFCH
jgi:ribonuclease HII